MLATNLNSESSSAKNKISPTWLLLEIRPDTLSYFIFQVIGMNS